MANQDEASKAMADALKPVYSTPEIGVEQPKPAEKWVYAPQVDEAEESVIIKSLWGKSDTIRDAVLAPKIKPFVEAVISTRTRRDNQPPLQLEESFMRGGKPTFIDVVAPGIAIAVIVFSVLALAIRVLFIGPTR